MPDKKDRPDTPNHATVVMTPDLELIRDVSRGTSSLRAQGKRYLPQAPAERTDDYRIRLNRAVFFNAFTRTIAGLTGMVFRRDPVLGEDVPVRIVEESESIDDAGTHLAVFTKSVFADCLEAGHAGILVDAPVTEGVVLSIGEERSLGIRPFWIHIKKDDIISWRTIVENGVERLSQLVLREIVIRPDGEFGEERIERFRVLQNDNGVIRFEIWEKPENKSEPIKTGEMGVIQNVTEIPFAIAYSRKVGFLTSIPPLIDLAYTNIAHYQVLADHLHALHLASVPVLYVTGVANEDLDIGPNTAVILPDPQSKIGYAEHSGQALDATRQQLIDFKTDMGVLGLGMLQPETRAAETAEAKRMDKSEQDSVLATAARSMQDAVEVAGGFHAQMIGQDPASFTIVLNQDFEKLTLDAAQIDTYSKLVLAGQISLETFWIIMQQGGALHDDFDPEVEAISIVDLLPPESPVVVVGE